MSAQPVAILTPMQIEADAVARGLGVAPARPRRPMAFERGGVSFIQNVIGIGACHLPAFDEKPGVIILAGLATEIAAILRVGTVVIGRDSTLATGVPYVRESFLCSAEPLLTQSSKYVASYATGDGAADRESGPVGAYAAKHAIPYMHLRAISERQQDNVDPEMLRMIDEFGNLNTRQAGKTFRQRPELLKDWARFRRDSRIALSALAAAIAAVVAELAASPPATTPD